jgi:hypothetical protein
MIIVDILKLSTAKHFQIVDFRIPSELELPSIHESQRLCPSSDSITTFPFSPPPPTLLQYANARPKVTPRNSTASTSHLIIPPSTLFKNMSLKGLALHATATTPTRVGRLLQEAGVARVTFAQIPATLADAIVPPTLDRNPTLATLTNNSMAFISTQDGININTTAVMKQVKHCLHVATYLPLKPSSSSSPDNVAEMMTLLFGNSLAYYPYYDI